MKLYNTLTRRKVDLEPLTPGQIKLYTCGPTVYHYAHIGNLRNVIMNDTLRRTLSQAGYDVRHVMNITDVGHLTSDADTGDDKLERGAKAAGKSVWEVAQFYAAAFGRHTEALGVIVPTVVVPATDEIEAQIELIKTLFDQGYAYQATQAIYFDVSRLADYGKLTGQSLADKAVGARDDVVTDSDKRHPTDFALWFFATGHFADHTMRWPSPWGEGFPGWHLECSAIIHKHLGETIDIHTGGVDHIGTHHTNEIAQSEAAYGKPLANIWLHNEFLQIDGAKMAKSAGTGLTLDDITTKGYHPMAFRLLILSSHYRSQQNFTWESLTAAQTGLINLYAWADLIWQDQPSMTADDEQQLVTELAAIMTDDLQTPAALAHILQLTLAPSAWLLEQLEAWLGLGLTNRSDITTAQRRLLTDREVARKSGDYAKSDELRAELASHNLEINDTPNGSIWKRTKP